MYNACVPDHPTPIIHVHGTADSTNPYSGTSTMTGINETVLFWVNQNNCDTTPSIVAVPDINTADNSTATHYLYSGGINGNTVEHFKVSSGGHTWPGSPTPGSTDNVCMDFDATAEIWRFFSQHERAPLSIDQYTNINLKIWPNPTRETLYFQVERFNVSEVKVYDAMGKLAKSTSGSQIKNLDVSDLNSGIYFVNIIGSEFNILKKIVVQSNE